MTRGAVILAVLVALNGYFAVGVLSALKPVDLPPPPERGDGAAPARAPEIEVFAPPELADLVAAIERPPFSQTRRPAAAPALPIAAPLDLNAVLNGVIISGEDRVAILTSLDDGEAVRLREGDVFLGWTLVEVQVDQVRLERDGREKRLELTFTGPAIAPPPPERRDRRRRAGDRDARQQPRQQEPQQQELQQQDQQPAPKN